MPHSEFQTIVAAATPAATRRRVGHANGTAAAPPLWSGDGAGASAPCGGGVVGPAGAAAVPWGGATAGAAAEGSAGAGALWECAPWRSLGAHFESAAVTAGAAATAATTATSSRGMRTEQPLASDGAMDRSFGVLCARRKGAETALMRMTR